ncbi:unnamed protein product, partial [Nesidiocoris tenuis]
IYLHTRDSFSSVHPSGNLAQSRLRIFAETTFHFWNSGMCLGSRVPSFACGILQLMIRMKWHTIIDSNRMRKREKGEKRGKTRSFRQENVMYELYREQSSRLRSAGEDDIKLGRLGD